MKYYKIFLLTVVMAVVMLGQGEAYACTNLIVGKKASADGSVMCTYSCDDWAFAGSLSYIPGGKHKPGEKAAVASWGGYSPHGFIPQVPFTYALMGQMNEKQLTIVETTFDGRTELLNREGLLDYFSIMAFGLQRCDNARDAIKCMTDLVEIHGYGSTGESITICDKNEAWIMEIIGKGPGRKGAVWVAVRIPDDCISGHANISRIRQFPLDDPENCMYAPDVISFAREMGFFSGEDKDFSFRDAYCPIDFENVRYADSRIYSFFRHHTDKAEMDKYLPYINGDFDVCDHLPLWIKPDKPVSVRDLMDDMRDHYEGTPLDMTADMSAGPWKMPIRPQPMQYEANGGKRYFMERPIAIQKVGFTMLCQMRNWLPDAVGGISWFNLDEASMIAYVPIYCGSNVVPEPFRRESNDYGTFSENSAFWINNFVANMTYPRHSIIYPDVREAQVEMEDWFEEQVALTSAAFKGGKKDIKMLNRQTALYTDRMMERWKKLAKLIIVKHNDLIMLPSENGEIPKNYHGGITRPGYSQEYREQIAKDLGDRYLMKEKSSAGRDNLKPPAWQ